MAPTAVAAVGTPQPGSGALSAGAAPDARAPAGNRRGKLAWALYGMAGRAASPLGRPYLAYRARLGREDRRAAEKLGIPSLPAFSEPPIWLHAVSVGESVAALTLAGRLIARAPILLTTSTTASAARVESELGPRMVHQYAPLDASPFVARFLDHWRPAAALFTESEVWPTTLGLLARNAVPRAHVNARLSERTFGRWQRRPWLARPLFSLIDLALAQSGRQAERFAGLGVRRVEATGNLKFDAAAPASDPTALAILRDQIAGRPVLLAASTHPGEEALVLAAHRIAARQRPDILTIIAPRHCARGAAVAALAGGATRRAAGQGPTGRVYVADTMGELGTLFAVADVVLLGGSLVPVGGHNPAEPAAFGLPLLTGPSHGAMFEPFLHAGAARIVAGADELAAAVVMLLGDAGLRRSLGEAASAVLAAERGAADRTILALESWLECPGQLR